MMNLKDPCFTRFSKSIECYSLPERFTYPFEYEPHPLSILAAEELQNHLETQIEWNHNFGLEQGKEGKVIGKMFGVLVVTNAKEELGYLSAFSGKLAGGNHHSKFVPPVYDALTEGSFLNEGMPRLNQMSAVIKELQLDKSKNNQKRISELKTERKNFSVSLQEQLFDNYSFLNIEGEEKNLRDIFKDTIHKNPPSGAGDCAAPKLLQYAFQHKLKPLAFAEFWWGLSPKSYFWEHKHFYPACELKCKPILKHMLEGMLVEPKTNGHK
ncbi:pseudouridylate synthase [Owenweeksia hongkongensis]|uniref:pseudouridylate synthase n=1 Tax=Owenweeksia hongkongensis TaxID=253245 RepID=UPI003A91D212